MSNITTGEIMVEDFEHKREDWEQEIVRQMKEAFHGDDNPDNEIGRYGVPGLFSALAAPARGSVEEQAFGTGWTELDEILKFYLGQFVLVTGIAGHGKSVFLFNVITKLARERGIKSFLFVPENEGNLYHTLSRIWSDEKTFERFAKDQCFVQSSHQKYWKDKPKTLQWVLERATVSVVRDKAEVVIIDPWNELEWAKPRDQLMTDYIRDCLMYLKEFTRAFNVVTILVAHPTKAINESSGRVPRLADIEGSMNWFNKCDNGLIVVREKNNAKVISAKVREIGAGREGACYFNVESKTGRFAPIYGGVDLG
jgi:twinkle protein